MKKTGFLIWLCAAVLAAGCGSEEAKLPQNTDQAQVETMEESENGLTGETQAMTTEETETVPEAVTAEETGAVPDTGAEQEEGGKLSYQRKKWKQSYELEDGTVFLKAEIEYPEFDDGSETARKLNEFYAQWLEKQRAYLEDGAESPVETGREFFSSGEYQPAAAWELISTMGDIKYHGGFFSVLHDSYEYSGGAHGNPSRENFLFRAADGEAVQITDVIGITQEDAESLVKSGFRTMMETEGEEGFYEDARETLEAKTLTEIPSYFSDQGVTFYFSPYEIAPYARGYVELTIPYENLGM